MLKIYRKKVAGEKRGKMLGFPTLNFSLKKTDKIKRGVWLVKLKTAEKSYFGAANAGLAKTFGAKKEKIEVHLFAEPSEKIKEAEVYFLKYLRPTKKFDAIENLKKQIKKDVKEGLCFLELLKKKG